MRIATAAAVTCLSMLGSVFAADVQASMRKPLHIPAQKLGPALRTLAKEREFQIIYLSDSVEALSTSGAAGQYTIDEALKKLLSGSGLAFQYVDAKTVSIVRAGTETLPSANLSTADAMQLAQLRNAALQDEPEQISSSIESRQDSDGPPLASLKENDDTRTIEEVIVTAQKRSERLQDVPVPVTAISGETLARSNSLRLQDYFTKIPGFTVITGIPQQTILSIRGISTGTGTNPTVGIAVDDVPYGATSGQGGGNIVPDIDPSDLARIEVLRGPQGTLYGANSMGGLLKFVTIDPSTDLVSGRVQAGSNFVNEGDEPGYNIRGALNVPISETVAVRASGFFRRDAGYIDDPAHGREDVNSGDIYGGMASALWRPADSYSLKLTALVQQVRLDGRNEDDIPLGDLQQNRLAGTGVVDREIQAYSATMLARLGKIDMASITGYNINSHSDVFDSGFVHNSLVRPVFGPSSVGRLTGDNSASKFTQEIRASVPIGEKIDWLIGGFYTDERREFVQEITGANPLTGTPIGSYRRTDFPTTYKEYAVFINATFRITDRFDVQIGGRESENKQTFEQTQTGPGTTAGGNQPGIKSQAESFTYLVTPRFKVTPDIMVYARIASGYRPGGPNADAGPGTVLTYDADTTRNYELGAKGDILRRALSFDLSLYYIEWTDIQLAVTNPTTARGFIINASGAKSQGIELSLESRPMQGLTIAAWGSYNNAVLTKPFPVTSTAARGFPGDRLPFATRWSGSFSVEQEFSLTNSLVGDVGASISYVGDRTGSFRGPGQTNLGVSQPRQILPAYAQVDLHAGLSRDSWEGDLFVTNLTDKRGALYGGLGALPDTSFAYIRPRTVGLNITRRF